MHPTKDNKNVGKYQI